MNSLRIATRKSPLALWQANYVKDKLAESHPDLAVELVAMTTKGDKLLDRSLATEGGKGLFLKELEASLLNNETDIAVHSMKDVPVTLPDGLEIVSVCEREDPRDAFVSNSFQNLYALPNGSRVGTSSLRRVAQLKSSFPNLKFIELRGNVNTRLEKLDDGDYDAIILAAAGLIRLNMIDRIKQYIPPQVCLPAVGQGIVGIECRVGDDEIKTIVQSLHSQESAIAIAAERAMNAALDSGCQMPVAGYAKIDKGKIRMRGKVGSVDGLEHLSSDISIKTLTVDSAAKLGGVVAKDLLRQGAGSILSSLRDKPFELPKAQKPVVILTREEKYLGNTPSLLSSLDYEPVHLPSLHTKAKYGPEMMRAFVGIEQYTDVLFVSRNAVEVAVPAMREQSGIPDGMRVMAVGAETAKQLYEYGIDALFPDHGSGADALLKVQQLQNLEGRKVLVVRGEYGLDWPAREMEKRGAEVHSVKCYEQAKPIGLQDEVDAFIGNSSHLRVRGIFIHSALSAKNLLPHILAYPEKFKEAKLIAGSEQIAFSAQDSGWENEIIVARSPSNKHMMIAFSK